MESVLLTMSMKFPHDARAETFSAVKVNEFYLATGSAFVSLLEPSGKTGTKAARFKEFYDLHFWAIFPGNEYQSNGSLRFRRIFCTAIYNSDLVNDTVDRDLDDVEFKDSLNSSLRWTRDIFGVLILFSETPSRNELGKGLQELYGVVSPINRRMLGSPVAAISTPFKNFSLFNTYSQGVISNVFGKEECLLMVDVKLSSGCEGSPLFLLNNRLVGLVLNVFTWVKGEWTGFSLAIHLYPIVRLWMKSASRELYASVVDRPSLIAVPNIDSYGVVLVRTPSKWGSGVVINTKKGIILTCSHVVHFCTKTDVTVEYRNKSYVGKVLYATAENVPFDLALIKVNAVDFEHMLEFKRPTKTIEEGESIYVISYPLFSMRKPWLKGASLTHGYVAKVYPDVMVITSCVSNSGASGGALMRENGELLGVVTNNLMVRSENLLVPHITVVIPSCVFWPPVDRFCSTNSILDLASLTTADRRIRDIWQLTFTKRFIRSKL